MRGAGSVHDTIEIEGCAYDTVRTLKEFFKGRTRRKGQRIQLGTESQYKERESRALGIHQKVRARMDAGSKVWLLECGDLPDTPHKEAFASREAAKKRSEELQEEAGHELFPSIGVIKVPHGVNIQDATKMANDVIRILEG